MEQKMRTERWTLVPSDHSIAVTLRPLCSTGDPVWTFPGALSQSDSHWTDEEPELDRDSDLAPVSQLETGRSGSERGALSSNPHSVTDDANSGRRAHGWSVFQEISDLILPFAM